MNKYLEHYLVAIDSPAVSGFEHLEMLHIRDELAEQQSSLSAAQQAQLEAADRRLLAQATDFCAELNKITDLSYERQRRQPPPERWWWYLDVLSQLPAPSLPAELAEPNAA